MFLYEVRGVIVKNIKQVKQNKVHKSKRQIMIFFHLIYRNDIITLTYLITINEINF